LSQKIIGRQEAFDSMPFSFEMIFNQNCRGPLSAKTLEYFRLFFDVDFDRNEVIRNELNDFSIRIYLGIQPGTSRSHRGGAEIKQ
jgi:hypothetical protein